jgi:hypothetical protein
MLSLSHPSLSTPLSLFPSITPFLAPTLYLSLSLLSLPHTLFVPFSLASAIKLSPSPSLPHLFLSLSLSLYTTLTIPPSHSLPLLSLFPSTPLSLLPSLYLPSPPLSLSLNLPPSPLPHIFLPPPLSPSILQTISLYDYLSCSLSLSPLSL